MVKRARLTRSILLAAVSLALLMACGGRDTGEVSSAPVPRADTEAGVLPNPGISEALIVFLSGDAVVHGPGGERFPEIGESIVPGERIMTGPDGFVELQLGNLGAVHISGDTEYVLETVVLTEDGGRAAGRLNAGSVIAKVRKLTGNDAFEVNVPGAVCAVRGTQFLVRADETGSVTIAVSEGRVLVAPPSLAAAGKGIGESESLDEVRSLMPLVGADEELVLETVAFAEAESRIAAWQAAAQVASPQSTESETRRGGAALAELKNEILQTTAALPTTAVLTESNRRTLQEKAPRLIEVSVAEPQAPVGEDAPVLVPLTVRVDPAASRILVDSRYAGSASASLILREGSAVDIRAEHPDGRFIERRVLAGTERIVDIRFEEQADEDAAPDDPDAAGNEEASLRTEDPAAESGILEVQAFPETAEIRVDGSHAGQGSAQVEIAGRDEKELRIQAPGFNEYRKVVALADTQRPLRVELEPRPFVNRVRMPGRGVGTPASAGDRAVLTTIEGTLVALNRDGEPLWITETKNSGGENASPVIVGNRVYAVGDAELVVVNLRDGRIVARRDLDGGREDLFGRRPVPIGSQIAVPGDATMDFINPDTAESVASMEIPQGSRATPGVWNGKLIVANQRGALLYINPTDRVVERTVATEATQPIGQAPAIGSGGTAVIVGRRGTASAVNLQAGTVSWSRPLAGEETIRVYTDPVIQGRIAYIYGDGRLFALNVADGTDRFAPIQGVTAPPMVRGGLLVLCREGGVLSIHDRNTGRAYGEFPLEETATARPVALGDYILVAGERSAIVIDPRSMASY